MKKQAPSRISTVALVAVAVIGVVDATTSTLSHSELVEMSLLSLEEFNSIRASETPNDFGEDNDDLWEEAAIFEYEVRYI